MVCPDKPTGAVMSSAIPFSSNALAPTAAHPYGFTANHTLSTYTGHNRKFSQETLSFYPNSETTANAVQKSHHSNSGLLNSNCKIITTAVVCGVVAIIAGFAFGFFNSQVSCNTGR